MEISNNTVVSVAYELRFDDHLGEIIESVNAESPFSFIYGLGQLLPKFESNLKGLKVGDKFEFGLDSTDAYGEVDENAIVELPKNIFEVDGEIDNRLLKVGNHVPMQDSNGNRLTGVVTEVTDQMVTMDFNHPLAGEKLFFSGMVTDVRTATDEELNNKRLASQGGCEGCGGGCSNDEECSCDESESSCGCGCN